MTTENHREARNWEGADFALQDWKVQEKGTTVILTRLHGAEQVRLWFSTKNDIGEDQDDGDDDDDNADNADNADDEDEDDNEENEEALIKCKVSFYKPGMGVLLILAGATENSFKVRSIAHDSCNTRKYTTELEWESPSVYFGKYKDLEASASSLDAYLQERGINEKLALSIMQYAGEKEKQEQTIWLRAVQNFIHN